MSSEEKKVENSENEADIALELGVYELGFHLLPIIAEEKLDQETSNIKSIIEKNGGLFIGEEGSPKKIDLAYSMNKTIDNKKTIFDTAYFGWVKFEANSLSIDKMQNALEKNNSILRFILIKSVKESKIISRKPISVSKPYSEPVKTSKASNVEEEGPISEAQVDKAIDELVAE